MNRLSICLLLTTLLLTVPPAVSAAPPAASASNSTQSWYDIELIVFRYTDPDAGNLESWPADPGKPDWQQATPLVTPTTGSTGNNALTPLAQIPGHQLDSDWNRLAKTSGYQPLLHVAWEEPLQDHSTAPTIRIGVPPAPPPASDQTESGPNEGMPAATAIEPDSPNPAPASVSPAAPASTAALMPVYGTVKFSQYGPYLHFDVDIACQGPLAKNVMHVPTEVTITAPAPASVSTEIPALTTSSQTAAPTEQWYRMTQDRRIEAGRLNYFDNPMFGVLVLVTPHPVTTAPLK